MRCFLKNIINELGVTIVTKHNLDVPGTYIPQINTIVLSENLEGLQEMHVLLHELGHAAKHNDKYILYNRLLGFHFKMEKEADEFMVKNMLGIYLKNPDINIDTFNPISFLDSHEFNLSHEHLVKKTFLEYTFPQKNGGIK